MSFPYQTPLISKPDDASWDNNLEALPGVTRITEDNIGRLNNLLAGCDEVDSYLTSPTYYQFTGRRGLWLYEKDDGFLLICRHPNVVDQILIFPQLGKSQTDLIAEIVEAIPASDDRVRLARVKDDKSPVHDSLILDTRTVVFRKCQEDILDWKYPVHVLSTDKVAALEGSQYKRLRYSLKQANDNSPLVKNFDAISHSRALENLLHRWASLNAKTREEYELLYAPYDNLFSQSMEKNAGLSGLMVFVGDELQAVSLWDVSNTRRKTANLYVDFCNVQMPGLSEFLIVKSCEELQKQGVKYLNIGGSEGEGLDSFKRKFRPTTSLDMHSVDTVIAENSHPSPVRILDPSIRLRAALNGAPSV